MKSLVTKDAFVSLRQMADTISWDKDLKKYAIEAQRFDILPFMTNSFFWAMHNSTTKHTEGSIYYKLLHGTEWTFCDETVYFDGLELAIVYFGYSRYIQHAPIISTKYGVVQKTNEFSVPVEDVKITREVAQTRQSGKAILEDAKLYLDNNTDIYTLWASGLSNDASGGAKLKCITNY